jgi:hypothetical protein
MPNLTQLKTLISETTGRPLVYVRHTAEFLQSENLLPRGKGGRGGGGAAVVTEKDAVALLIGCCDTEGYRTAAEAVKAFMGLPADTTASEFHVAPTFGEELANIICDVRRSPKAPFEINRVELIRSGAGLSAKIAHVLCQPLGEIIEKDTMFGAPLQEEKGIAHTTRIPGDVLGSIAALFGEASAKEEVAGCTVPISKRSPHVDRASVRGQDQSSKPGHQRPRRRFNAAPKPKLSPFHDPQKIDELLDAVGLPFHGDRNELAEDLSNVIFGCHGWARFLDRPTKEQAKLRAHVARQLDHLLTKAAQIGSPLMRWPGIEEFQQACRAVREAETTIKKGQAFGFTGVEGPPAPEFLMDATPCRDEEVCSLPQIFEKHFKRPFGASNISNQTEVGGPGIRFARKALEIAGLFYTGSTLKRIWLRSKERVATPI